MRLNTRCLLLMMVLSALSACVAQNTNPYDNDSAARNQALYARVLGFWPQSRCHTGWYFALHKHLTHLTPSLTTNTACLTSFGCYLYWDMF